MNAVIKRTAAVTQTFKARNWVKDYIDETKKHEGKDLSEMGVGIGKTYFTSRPTGSVTAHGYAREQLLKYQLTHHVSGNDAVLGFIEEHCRKQRLRDRKILGLRFVISVDPVELQAQVRALVDVDQLFERIAEDTFADFAKQFYPGDEIGFIMGIHHDAMTGKRNRGQTLGPAKPSLPHIHGHLFVFPQTRKGLRVSFSNHTVPGRDGKFLDLHHELWLHYQGVTLKHLDEIGHRPEQVVTPGLSMIAREACLSACEDTDRAPEMKPEERWRYRINRAMFQLKTLDRNMLYSHFNKRQKQIKDLQSESDRKANQQEVREKRMRLAAFEGYLKEERRTILEPCLLGEPTILPDPLPVKFSDINGLRPVLVEKPRLSPDRSQVFRKTLQNLHHHRQSTRVLVEGTKARIELIMAALTTDSKLPWVSYLEEMSKSATPPHQHFLDLGRQLERTQDEEYSVPAKTIDRASVPEVTNGDKPVPPSSQQSPSL